jgi:hypothetical protein
MPASAGIQRWAPRKKRGKDWIPAPRLKHAGTGFAGMTTEGQPVDLFGNLRLAGGSNSVCRWVKTFGAKVIYRC